MDFRSLIKFVGDEPVFESSLLLAGEVNPVEVQRQLSRRTRAGRLHQLQRGLYILAPPFQKIKRHPFGIANYYGARLVRQLPVRAGALRSHAGTGAVPN